MTERFKIKINIRKSDGDEDTAAMTEPTAATESGFAKTMQRSRRFLGMEAAIVGIAVLGALIAIALTPAVDTPAVDTEVAGPSTQPADVGAQSDANTETGSMTPARSAPPADALRADDARVPNAEEAEARAPGANETTTVLLQPASAPPEPVDASAAAGLAATDAGAAAGAVDTDAAAAGPADAVGAFPPLEAPPPLAGRVAHIPSGDTPPDPVDAAPAAAEPGAVRAGQEVPPMEPEAEASAEAPTAMEPVVTDVLAASVGIPAEAVARDEALGSVAPGADDATAPPAEPSPDALAEDRGAVREASTSGSRPPVSAGNVAGGPPQEAIAALAVPHEPATRPGSDANPPESDRTPGGAEARPAADAPESILAAVVPDPKPGRSSPGGPAETAAAGDGQMTLDDDVQQGTALAVPARKPDAALPSSETSPSINGNGRSATGEEPAQDLAALPEPAPRPSVAALEHVTTTAGDAVARAYLTTGIRGREPVDTITSGFNFPSEDGREFFYFTELQGLAGKTVVHRWERDGRFEGDVNFPVGSNRWRVYSTKKIAPDLDGVWTVTVRTKDGRTLAATEFVVRRQ